VAGDGRVGTVSLVERYTSGAGPKGVLYMSAFAVMFAIVEGLGVLLPAGYSPYQVVWARYLVHLVLTLAVMLALDRSLAIRSVHSTLQVCRSAMMLVMPVAFVMAAGAARVGLVWTLLWLAPLMAIAWAKWHGDTSLGAIDWLIALACLAGAVLVLRPGPALALTGTLFALLSAGSFAAYILMTGGLHGDSVLTSLFYTATVPFLALSLVMPSTWTPVTPRAALVFTAIGVVGWGALLALDRGVRLLGSARASIFAFLAVVVGAGLERDTDRATMTGAGIIGIALIGAAILAIRRTTHPPETASSMDEPC
jgi:drug/metabolite transporter (DMT)-like permease